MSSDRLISKYFVVILCVTHLFLVTNGVGLDSERYSAEEQDALSKFRPLVQNLLYRDYMKRDQFLIRWLRARDLDISGARSMLGKAIKWRKENKIDTIVNETILTLPIIPFYHDSVSYSGHPVSTMNIRAFEMKKWILAGKRTELLRFMNQILELGEVGVRYLNERFPWIHQFIIIFDNNGYNQRQQGCLSCILMFQQWLRHYENYYPQMAKAAYVVNSPRIIKPVLHALKPFLSPHSQKILKIFGHNKQEWRRELFKIVPRNQLRRDLGGTKPDYVPCAVHDFVCMCKEFFKSAGQGTNTTISLSAGLRKLDASIC